MKFILKELLIALYDDTPRKPCGDVSFSCLYGWETKNIFGWIQIYVFFSEKKSFRFAIYSGVDQKRQTIGCSNIRFIFATFCSSAMNLWADCPNCGSDSKTWNSLTTQFHLFQIHSQQKCFLQKWQLTLRLLRLWLWHQNTAHLKLLFRIFLGHLHAVQWVRLQKAQGSWWCLTHVN